MNKPQYEPIISLGHILTMLTIFVMAVPAVVAVGMSYERLQSHERRIAYLESDVGEVPTRLTRIESRIELLIYRLEQAREDR